ncbi:MAG: O-antigen ligase family protein [Cyclobacteriaceae bacterium]
MTQSRSEVFYKWWKLAWWLCIVTLPWLDVINNASIIILAVLWFSEGGFVKRFREIQNNKWAWPLFLYYLVLLVGAFYTRDFNNALFTFDKKISFVVLPLLAITGLPLDQKIISTLKRSFAYSCATVIAFCIGITAIHFISGGGAENFDVVSNNNYNTLHPSATTAWMHFSYIQLSHWAGIHPGYFSMYLAFSIVILFTENVDSRFSKTLNLFLATAMAVFIALLSSRMAILAFCISTIFLVVVKIKERRTNIIVAIVLVLVVMGFLLTINPISKFRLFEEPITTNYQADSSVMQWNSVSYRLLEWQGAWSVIKDNILFGVGTGGGTLALMDFYSHFNSSTVGIESNAHNQFLQTWMELGIIGLFVFISCLFGPLILAQSYSNTQYVCFLIIFIMMCLTESVVERQKGVVFFTFFQTLFLGFERKAK